GGGDQKRPRGSKRRGKGSVLHCPHVERPLYSRGVCKPCYMVDYWNRKNAAMGLPPRTARTADWGTKKRAKLAAMAERRKAKMAAAAPATDGKPVKGKGGEAM
ncbi:unnamed protein product, partial [Discosporangium mesarthrocarpum]